MPLGSLVDKRHLDNIGCGNARLFVSLKLEIRISVATVHLHSHM